jgi:hypothetical protein
MVQGELRRQQGSFTKLKELHQKELQGAVYTPSGEHKVFLLKGSVENQSQPYMLGMDYK